VREESLSLSFLYGRFCHSPSYVREESLSLSFLWEGLSLSFLREREEIVTLLPMGGSATLLPV